MQDDTILVAAPRKKAFNPRDPQSPIVFSEVDMRHPANPDYASPAGEVCICAGEGVTGDPGRANNPRGNPPWEVFPTPEVAGALRSGKLVEIRRGEEDDTSDLALSENDLGTLTTLTERQVEALQKKGITGVNDLADRVTRSDDPVDYLVKTKAVGKGVALDLLNELVALGHITAAPTE